MEKVKSKEFFVWFECSSVDAWEADVWWSVQGTGKLIDRTHWSIKEGICSQGNNVKVISECITRIHFWSEKQTYSHLPPRFKRHEI